jgi:hypothetical protein
MILFERINLKIKVRIIDNKNHKNLQKLNINLKYSGIAKKNIRFDRQLMQSINFIKLINKKHITPRPA